MKCILFDLDGTIQDSEKLATDANRVGFRTILGREATDDELEQLVGKPVAKVIVTMFPESGNQIFEKAVEHYDTYCHSIRCYDGVKEMMNAVKLSGFAMGIVSSKRRKYILKELEANSITDLFTCIIGQEDTVDHKPNAAPLLMAAKQMEFEPEQCLYIGDQPTDILAAQAAGMKSAAALWGEGRKERLSSVSPDYFFETPQIFLDFIKDG
ncbi:HAD family hydrolase [Paenibacillus sp. Soil522]|uniref:HAD family hydrolase n=1 Tax=Paenibacillus sp. Soil522 TaxID=1736388 RepID=UPI0006F2F837|nr:HAD-IA family hydrolase [Paenibacillus sp. Soil522]KRE34914.1 hypothetical protein ASG81_22755 [Paenibacillus sp. Soil522]